MMKRAIVYLSLVALLTACPDGDGMRGEGEGESMMGGDPTNSVEIRNDVPLVETNPEGVFDIVEVSVDLSGSGQFDPIDLRNDPIEPGEFEVFCCYDDGTYDIRIGVLFRSGEELDALVANNIFIGPRSHVFTSGVFRSLIPFLNPVGR